MCYSDPMGKRREPDIFDDNQVTQDFSNGWSRLTDKTAGEVSGLVFATLANASVDAKRRKVIWADGERLSTSNRQSASMPSIRIGPAS